MNTERSALVCPEPPGETGPPSLRESIVDLLLRLRSLPLFDLLGIEFERTAVMCLVAMRLDARAELGEALIRYTKAVEEGEDGES